MYVAVRDESMEEATSAEGVGHVVSRTANMATWTGESVMLLWTCRRSTFFSRRLPWQFGPGPASESERGVYDCNGANLEYQQVQPGCL
jgi:hypothetical protein